jgi:secreted PhoX family phosphatase
LIYESPGPNVLDNPDNITVSPRGGLVLCEDGGGVQYLRGLTLSGDIFDFAVNQVSDFEFAGATYSPDGQTLYVNIQGETSGRPTDPGVKGSGLTMAIWGPWSNGAL